MVLKHGTSYKQDSSGQLVGTGNAAGVNPIDCIHCSGTRFSTNSSTAVLLLRFPFAAAAAAAVAVTLFLWSAELMVFQRCFLFVTVPVVVLVAVPPPNFLSSTQRAMIFRALLPIIQWWLHAFPLSSPSYLISIVCWYFPSLFGPPCSAVVIHSCRSWIVQSYQCFGRPIFFYFHQPFFCSYLLFMSCPVSLFFWQNVFVAAEELSFSPFSLAVYAAITHSIAFLMFRHASPSCFSKTQAARSFSRLSLSLFIALRWYTSFSTLLAQCELPTHLVNVLRSFAFFLD